MPVLKHHEAAQARKREKALAPPAVPDSHTQAVFTDWSTSFRPPPRPEAALWVKVFCEHRDELQGAILSADPLKEGGPAFRFVCGVQSPRLAVFQEVFEHTHPLPVCHPEREEDLMLQAQQWHAWRFSLVLGSYYTHLQLPFEDEEMSAILEAYPHKHRHRETSESELASSKARATVPEVDLVAHPWLQEYLNKQKQPHTRPAASRTLVGSASTKEDARDIVRGGFE